MRLKYAMREESHRLVAVDPVYHDAAVAHALVRAMGEYEADTMMHKVPSTAWIRRRANELMREWGYPDET